MGAFNTATSVAGIDAIKKTVEQNRAWTDQAIKMVTDSREEEQLALEGAAINTQIAGQMMGAAKQMEGTIEAAAVQSRKRILDILNLDTNELDNAMAQYASEYATLDAQRRKSAELVDKKMQVGFFDDPLQYLINATQLPGMVAEHNAIARKQNDAVNALQTAQGIVGIQERIAIAASADQIAELGVARGNALQAEQNARAEVLRAQGASSSARTATTVVGLRGDQLRMEMSVAQMEKIMEGYREGADAKADQKDQERLLDERLKTVGELMGAPYISLAAVKRMSKKEQDFWMKRASEGTIGNNLYEASIHLTPGMLQTMQKTGSASLVEFMRKLQTKIMQGAQDIAADVQSKGGKIPPREELLMQSARNVENEFFVHSQNMLNSSDYNPYKINHNSMATHWDGDPNNYVAKMVIDGAKNRISYTDKQIFEAVSSAVKQGSLNPTVAAQQYSDYYTSAVAQNNKRFSYGVIGLSTQNEYNILPKGVNRSINLLAPGQLENVLTQVDVQSFAGRRPPAGLVGPDQTIGMEP